MTVHFRGEIVKVARDGRSALVMLENGNLHTCGYQHAIISPSTQGRAVLMNGSGELVPRTKVEGDALKGPKALLATSITKQVVAAG